MKRAILFVDVVFARVGMKCGEMIDPEEQSKSVRFQTANFRELHITHFYIFLKRA